MLRLLAGLAVLAAPVLLYRLVIRPRLEATFTEIYAHLDSFWARLRARLYAFRSFVAGAIGSLAVALPMLAEELAGLDLSPLLPDGWNGIVSAAVAIYLVVNRAFATRPREEPA